MQVHTAPPSEPGLHQHRLSVIDSSPATIEVPLALKNIMPGLRAELAAMPGNLAHPEFQAALQQRLMGEPAWREWILENRRSMTSRPILLRSGLTTELDDDAARKLLVGFAICMEPGSIAPPYSIGGLAVTEVLAQPRSTPESHSQNDLPAPPHTAGFFEDIPPRTCYFSCIRPHAGGGAETTVVNTAAILAQAPQALIEEWSGKTYYLKTSKRLGSETKPFQLLTWIDGAPFFRYRKEYTVGFEEDRSLKLLEEMIRNPANHFIVALKAGETLVHWNGSPHSRMPQHGQTPDEILERRKLIRCRTVPMNGWQEHWLPREPFPTLC